jgi:hypothetical protein
MTFLFLLLLSLAGLAWLAGIIHSLWHAGAWINKVFGVRALVFALAITLFSFGVFASVIHSPFERVTDNKIFANSVLIFQVFGLIFSLLFSLCFGLAGFSSVVTNGPTVIQFWKKKKPLWRFLLVAIPLDFLIFLLWNRIGA